MDAVEILLTLVLVVGAVFVMLPDYREHLKDIDRDSF